MGCRASLSDAPDHVRLTRRGECFQARRCSKSRTPWKASEIGSLPTAVLIAIFAAAAVATWIAGTALSKTTDVIDRRFGLGEALGGMILLAIAGSLPEIAITVSAAAKGNLGLAAGNLIGGIAIQTMVLVICDAAASRTQALSFLVGSLVPVLEALLVTVVVAEVMMGALLPESARIGPMSPASIVIVITWVVGVYVLNKARSSPAWKVEMVGSKPGRPHRRVVHAKEAPSPVTASPRRAVIIFVASSIVTLIAGVLLELTGNELASKAGINGVIFGATVLALASALPEISSGVAAVRLGDNQLAVADIFGGNAFQVCLFVVADLIAGSPVLPTSGALNAWLAGLGIVLTMVYAFGVIIRPRRVYVRLGIDSLLVLVGFAVGIAGLVEISHHLPHP
jgi:cation:H+ antiporter